MGAVDIRIAGLAISKAPLIDAHANLSETKTPYLVFVIELKKNSPNKKRILLSWQRYKDNRINGADAAVLFVSDDKALAPARVGGAKLNVELAEKQELPDDGTPIRDILLFAVPPEDVNKLTLRLDAGRLNETEDILFELPSSAWKMK